jgi:antitoxin component of RelBE/YafQ-DinJ toxin-antitoxin module
MVRVATDKSFPFDLREPNAETVEAMKAGLRGEITRVSSVAQLFETLNADD